jgi:N-acetylneuraminic acid mutarotase
MRNAKAGILMAGPLALQTFLYAEDRWKMAPALPSPRGEIIGTVVAQKWYVMAGLDTTTNRPIGSVLAFDASSNMWTAKKSMPAPAHHIMTAALDGKIYVFRGFVKPADIAAWQPTNLAWVYLDR